MEEMDKSRELYSKEGDNSSLFEGKTVLLEHTIGDVSVRKFKQYHVGKMACLTQKDTNGPFQKMSERG